MPARRSVRLSVRGSVGESSPHPPALPAVTFLCCRLRALTWAQHPALRPAPRRTAQVCAGQWALRLEVKARGGGANSGPGSGGAGPEE